MKVLCYLCCALCLCVFSLSAQASSFSKDIFASDISLNMASSVQTDAVKYASVNFISRRSNIKMNDVSEGDDLDNAPIKQVECPAGTENIGNICVNVTACKKDFPLPSASKNVGVYVTKNCGSKGIGYCYTSCQTGWDHSDCNCNAVDCTGFPLFTTSGSNCDGIAFCKSGNTYKYKCTSCPMGYDLSNNKCVNANCSTNGSTTPPDHCTAVTVGKVGEDYCYECTACEDGYTLNSGACSPNTCSYSKNASIANCISHTVTRTGTDLCYQCTACATGYTLNTANTVCEANTCPKDSSTSMSATFTGDSISVSKVGTEYCYTKQ